MYHTMESSQQPQVVLPNTQPAAQPKPISTPKPNLTRILSYVLRSCAVGLSFLAAVMLGIARERLTVYFQDTADTITLFVKSTQFPAFLYLLIANVLVLVYSIVTLLLSIVMRGAMERALVLPFCLVVGDLVMTALLFSANGAAAAISMVGDAGQSGAGWVKICDVVDGFCGRVKAGIVLSMLAALGYVLLVLLMFVLVGMHKRSQ